MEFSRVNGFGGPGRDPEWRKGPKKWCQLLRTADAQGQIDWMFAGEHRPKDTSVDPVVAFLRWFSGETDLPEPRLAQDRTEELRGEGVGFPELNEAGFQALLSGKPSEPEARQDQHRSPEGQRGGKSRRCIRRAFLKPRLAVRNFLSNAAENRNTSAHQIIASKIIEPSFFIASIPHAILPVGIR